MWVLLNMAKFMVFMALTLLLAVSINALNYGECPPSSQMATCTPKCIQDSECSTMGGICCRNLCNTKSCVRPKQGSSYDKGSSGGSTGIYCGNVKCSAFEKCGIDKNTKRQQCIRS